MGKKVAGDREKKGRLKKYDGKWQRNLSSNTTKLGERSYPGHQRLLRKPRKTETHGN